MRYLSIVWIVLSLDTIIDNAFSCRSYVKTITATKKKMGGWHGNLKNIANILSNNSSRSSQTRHYSQYYGSGIPPTAICIKNSYLQVFCHGIMFPKMRSHVNQFHSLNFKKTFPTKISMPIFLKLLRYIK